MALGCTVLTQGVHMLKHCMALSNLPFPPLCLFCFGFSATVSLCCLGLRLPGSSSLPAQPFKSLDLQVFKLPNMALPALIDCCVLKPCACW